MGLYHHDGGTVRALEGVGESLGSRVNGYGGGTLAALPETVVAVTETQRLVAVEPVSGRCRVLAAEPGVAWGGLVPDPRRERVLAVREEASGQCLMAVDRRGRRQCLHRGEDFYGAPALSRCGRWLAWVSWRLPDMPWVRSRLWLAELNADGHPVAVRPCPAPASGSVQQPVFDDTGLWLLSDHAGWWQPWRVDPASGAWQAAPAPPLDHANAPWQLGERHHCPLPGGGWARVRYDQGVGTLWLSPAGGQACRWRSATARTFAGCAGGGISCCVWPGRRTASTPSWRSTRGPAGIAGWPVVNPRRAGRCPGPARLLCPGRSRCKGSSTPPCPSVRDRR